MMERMKNYPFEVTLQTDELYEQLEKLQGVADLMISLQVACEEGTFEDDVLRPLGVLVDVTYGVTKGLYGLIEEASKQKGAHDGE